jgi:multidrug efflux pump subunit AcrA (membrane-fusion protein)
MSKRAVVIGGVLVVGVAFVGLATVGGLLGSRPPGITYLTATASVVDLRDTVSISGSIEPVDTYGLAFGQAPDRSPKPAANAAGSTTAPEWTVASVDVQAGDAVLAGDVLAVAETGDAGLALDVARANLAAAEAKLKADESPVTKTTKAQAKLGVTQANSQLTQARKAQSQTQSSGRLAISQASAALTDAKAQLANDRAAGAPAAVIAADTAVVKQATRTLATARLQVASANTQAANQVAAAKLGVTSANLSYQGTTTVNTDAAVAADRASVAQAQSAVADAERTLARATLTAPIDGVVSSVTIKPGDTASGTVILLRGTQVQVTASVTESDLPSLKVGQPAEVTIAPLGATVNGAVDSVDLAGATKSAAGVVSYGVVIALTTPPALVAPSMTADVVITTASAPSVLTVPVTAIGGVPGAYTVQVLDGPGQVRTVPVEVGLLTPSLAEIRSGINEGTVVVTGTASAKDLVTTFPTGPGAGAGAGAGATPTSSQP